MDEEAKKKQAEEAAKVEADAKATADAKAAEDARLQKEIDYKALAEAEKARADAAEALIVKNKALAKREDKKDGDGQTLTKDDVIEIVKTFTAKEADDSVEAKALEEANKRLKELQAKNAEIARALKAKDGVSKDSASTHFDGSSVSEPKLTDNSPLKSYKYMGNGVYSKKLANGKTLYKNVNPGPGGNKMWVE